MITRCVTFSLIGLMMSAGIATARTESVLDGCRWSPLDPNECPSAKSADSIDGTGKPRCKDGEDRCTLGRGFGGVKEDDDKEEYRGSGRQHQ